MTLQLVVAEGDRGARLDQFVQRALSRDADAPSRAEVRRWIDLGAVLVNGTPRKPSEALRAGDVVGVTPASPPKTTAVAEEGIAFDVVYADDALVVVHKPAGLVVHPARSHPGGTLVNGLLARGYFDTLEADPDSRDPTAHYRPGIVHRIDKGTSGLLVVARTAVAREKLKAQFAAHTVAREYDAIALGDVTQLTHDTLYGRHPKDRLRFSTRVREGKRAVTHVRIVSRFGIATHVRCTLQTGRTHQLRVHLAESGTPILGDPLYGPRRRQTPRLLRWPGRSATRPSTRGLLGFLHPVTRKALRFEVDLPADVAQILADLTRSFSPRASD